MKAQIIMCQSIRFLGTTCTRMCLSIPLSGDFSQEGAYITIGPAESCEQIAQAMEVRGTRYLLVAHKHTSDGVIARLRDSAGSEAVIRERQDGCTSSSDKDFSVEAYFLLLGMLAMTIWYMRAQILYSLFGVYNIAQTLFPDIIPDTRQI